MNPFLNSFLLPWPSAAPSLAHLLPQDDIAANACARRRGQPAPFRTEASLLGNVSGEPENPLYESPPSVSTQTPWATETLLQTRGGVLSPFRS